MHVLPSKEANLRVASKLIHEAFSRYEPDIVGLPELFTTSFFPFRRDKRLFKLAEPIPGPTTEFMGKIARELGVYLIGPIFERLQGQHYYDSSPVISPDGGIVSLYRKCSIPQTVWQEDSVVNNEKFYFEPGSELRVVDLKKFKLGQLICYDRHFPEAWRALEIQGAQIIYVPNASVGRTVANMFTLESRVMCFLNQVFGVFSNRIGNQDGFEFFGLSHIVDPSGEFVKRPSKKVNDVVFSALDIEKCEKMRSVIQLLRDRRPDLYSDLVKPNLEI